MSSLDVSIYSIMSFCMIFFGYLIQSSLLELYYYTLTSDGDAERIKQWKCQPNHRQSVGKFYFHPLFSPRPNVGKYHRLFGSINIVMASLVAGTVTELCCRGYTRMKFHSFELTIDQVKQLFIDFLLIVSYENIVEYYWHRLMHVKFFYLNFHKFHHYYKSPEPFDDMYIHPVEAFGYYMILYSPAIMFGIHWYAFILYMMVMGICGITDHSGIKFDIPLIYNSIDHDNHHLKFEVNYGFPFIYLDLFHGTFEGTFAGKKYTRKGVYHVIESSDNDNNNNNNNDNDNSKKKIK